MIEFTELELQMLLTITQHVGGSPKGPRGIVDGIANKLMAVDTKLLVRSGGNHPVITQPMYLVDSMEHIHPKEPNW